MEPLFSKFFDDFKICVAPENKGDIRASYAVPQVALNSRGSLDVGWDMTDHRKRGAPSGSVNFVFVSCGTAVHLERHEKIRNIFCGTSVCCCCCLKKNHVVSHIQRIGCQPEKNYFTRWLIPLSSWSAEEGLDVL